MKVKNTCATFAFCALSVLSVSGKNNCSQEQFINLLNIEKGYKPMPQGFFFADLGGWHGYGFNRKSDLSLAGGFRGPAFAGERSLGLQ